MPRRTDHSREELYDLALAAARDIIREDGLSALTARRVAHAIGYSPGTLYNVFDDLDDLIVHMNGRTLDALYDDLMQVAKTDDPARDLKALLAGYLAFLDGNRNLWGVLFEHRLSGDAALPDWYLQKIDQVLGLIETTLARRLPDLDRDNLKDAARILWASLHGICSLSGSGKLQIVSDQTVHAMAETLMTRFVAGLEQTRVT
ncbi:MAG: TetR/AcrR family transcriptional regulator [Pseudomonadota bacterium]